MGAWIGTQLINHNKHAKAINVIPGTVARELPLRWRGGSGNARSIPDESCMGCGDAMFAINTCWDYLLELW